MSTPRFAMRALPLAILIAGLWSLTARAAEPLVDVAWVKANLGNTGVVLLDVRSGAGVTRDAYLKGHIPGAVFTDYAKGGWREKTAAGVEGQLPSAEKLAQVIGGLGIDNATHVVLVPEGRNAIDVGAATRLYWTLKVLGHDEVSILNGGHTAWVAEVDKDKKPVNPLDTTDVVPLAKRFVPKLRSDMLVSKEAMQRAVADKASIVDNRPHDFHVGLTKSPAVKTAGTIPGAVSLPEGWLTQNGGGQFRSKAQLSKIYQSTKVPQSGPQITFCNTGHWASLGWFVSSELLGNKEVKLYAGSMAEWTSDATLPVTRAIEVD